nr:hypothetical protein [uncultured Draconibacterium sp.]
MLLNELPEEFRVDQLFMFKCGFVEYQCKATYLPFAIKDRDKYEVLELDKIYTPIMHLEWNTINTEDSIYQSHWIMPYDVHWWFENKNETTCREMIEYAALNNGYLQRMKDESSRLQKGVQMSLF